VEKDVIQDTLKEFHQASFHFTIMSKCGQEAKIPDFEKIDAVKSVDIVTIDNVGGCDYAYAKFLDDHYMQGRQKRGLPITDSESVTSKSVVLFLKDTPRIDQTLHQNKFVFSSYRSIPELVQTSVKGNFACGLAHGPEFSDYHDVETLNEFTITKYSRIGDKSIESSAEQFNPHGYANLGDFYSKMLHWEYPRQDYTLVCYGGTFSVPQRKLVSLFKDQNFTRVIKSIKSAASESSMSIAEHYTERTWAALLSEPLGDEDAMSLKKDIIGIVKDRTSIYGLLLISSDMSVYPKKKWIRFLKKNRR
jgi:hypothetical protein